MKNRIAIIVIAFLLTSSAGVVFATNIQPLDLTKQLEALSAKIR